MNDNRSPLWDRKLTFIGILIAVVIAATFILFNFNNKRYSDVSAAEQPTTEVTTEQSTETKEVEETDTSIKRVNYYSEYRGEEKARIAHKGYTYDEYEGIPDSVRLEIETMKAREEVDDVTDTTIIESITPMATNEDNVIDVEVIEESDEEVQDNSGMTYYGCLELTAYTWTGNPCADGVYPSSGYTVACNNSDLWHKWIYIEGYGNYYVHDTGGMGWGVIDVYMDSYDACIQFGRRSANIYILN